MKYRKRPVVIEARQLTGGAAQWLDVYKWIEENTLGSFEPLSVIEQGPPYPESGVSIDPSDGRLSKDCIGLILRIGSFAESRASFTLVNLISFLTPTSL